VRKARSGTTSHARKIGFVSCVSARAYVAHRAKGNSSLNIAKVRATRPIALAAVNLLPRAEGAIPIPVVSGREPEVVKNCHDPVTTGTKWHPFVPYFPEFEPGRFITDKGEGTIAGALIHGSPKMLRHPRTCQRNARHGRAFLTKLIVGQSLLALCALHHIEPASLPVRGSGVPKSRKRAEVTRGCYSQWAIDTRDALNSPAA
jgi:hypothetical protein